MEEEDIDLRSAEVQEVLEHSPAWIIRWGISFFFTVVVILIAGSWFFKYPLVLVAPIVITTENPPASIVARTTGKISMLFISDKQNVMEGQYLAYIENPADYSHYIETKSLLDSLQIFFKTFDTIYFAKNLESDFVLGDLQSGYSGLIKQYKEYTDFLRLDYQRRKIKSLREQIEKYQTYKKGLTEQYNILWKEHFIDRKQFIRDSLIFSQNLISEADFEKSEKANLQSKFEVGSADNLITSTQITINGLEQDIFNLEVDFVQQKKKYENELRSLYDNLLSQFKQFEYTYILKSPVDGKVAFTKYWSINQNVTSGELVFTIIPSDPKGLIGKVSLPIQRSGEAKIGQDVIIKLDNYQYNEYGTINGKVKSISPVLSNQTYIVEISLNSGLTTNYGKKLEFSQEMTGMAEIVTKDMRLIEKLIQPIRYIFKQNL